MKLRGVYFVLLALLSLGLAACVPSAATSTVELTASQAAAPAYTANPSPSPTGDQAKAGGDQQGQAGDELLVVPTLAPTATPGVIYTAVQQAVEATNLGDKQILGLATADWINLAISLLIVALAMAVFARLVFIILKKLTSRSANPYDEIYLQSIRPYLRWLIVLIFLYVATMRLQFLSPAIKQWLAQIYYILAVGLIVIGLWKLVDLLTLWYQEKVREREAKPAT